MYFFRVLKKKKKKKNWKTNSYCRSIGPCNRNSIKISMTQFFPIYILFFRIYLISWINWNFVLKLQYFSMHWTCSRSIQDTGQELRHVHVPFWRLNRKYDDLIWKSGSVVWADALYDDISLFFCNLADLCVLLAHAFFFQADAGAIDWQPRAVHD